MTPKLWKDRRRHPRVGVARSAIVRIDGAPARRMPAQVVDLSEGGLRAAGPLPDLASGAHLSVELRVPGWLGNRALSLPAQLVRLGQAGAGARHREFAVEFRPLPAMTARRLAGFVQRALRAQAKVAVTQGPDSILADALRMVRVSLGPAKPDRARVVLVTSAVPGEGKSFTAGHLASMLASEGQRVLLVDADLRNPSLAAAFGAAPGPGLAEWLMSDGEQPLADFAQPSRCGVTLLTGGRSRAVPESWSREDSQALVERLRSDGFDYVVIDSAPLLVAALSSLLAAAADDVLLVARAGTTRERDLREARRMLERQGANLRGVVLNDDSDSRQASYRAYHRSQRRSLRRLVGREEAPQAENAIYELVELK